MNFCDMRRFLAVLLAFAVTACGNMESDMNDCSSADVIFSVEVEGESVCYETKTILGGVNIETDVRSVTLAAYDGKGILADVKYYESGFSSMALELIPKLKYKVYALANMGDMTGKFPTQECDVPAMEYELSSYEDVGEYGIPMCGVDSVAVGRPAGKIYLERLFAKVSVRITHYGLNNSDPAAVFAYNLCNRSVYVRQANKRLRPFADGGSRAERAADVMAVSDYHAELDNFAQYEGHLDKNQGQLGPGPGYFQDTTVVLYVPENVQGPLLRGNSDPAAKVYDNIDGINGKSYGDLCTYIEFNAHRPATHGYSGSVMYRYYLGADNVTDFSIERNCVYSLTLDFTEGGFFADSWKVSRGDSWTDKRGLWFLEDAYTVAPGRDRDVLVHFTLDKDTAGNSARFPDRWTYSMDEDAMAEAGLSVSFDPNTLVQGDVYKDFCLKVTASADARVGSSFSMKVRTAVGNIVDHAIISIVEDSGYALDWTFLPEYVSQYGTFAVSGYEKEELPLQFSVSDGSLISCVKQGDNIFRVVAKGVGNASVTVSNNDGSRSVTANMNIMAPELVLDRSRLELNPDGESASVAFGYETVSGASLTNVDAGTFASVLTPVVSGDAYFAASVSSQSIDVQIDRLNDGSDGIVAGNVYNLAVGAVACDDVMAKSLKVEVEDPFESVGFSDYGVIHDYTLFTMSDAAYRLRTKFSGLVAANGTFSYPGPVPEADPSYVEVGLVPRWRAGFNNANGVYSASRNVSNGQITVRQQPITEATTHSAGVHDMMVSVKNRHSGEKLSRSCGELEIYVHTAIGADAAFDSQKCGYSLYAGGKTFADVYNAVAGRSVYSGTTSTRDIHYMDVVMKWMTPVKGVYVLNMASALTDSYDGLSIIKPDVEDGCEANRQLFSVCRSTGDDRVTIGDEPSGRRAGIGRLLYRSLLTTTFDQVLPLSLLHEHFFNYNASMIGFYRPLYEIADVRRVKDGIYYFAPSRFSEYVDSDGMGYHVIHPLESIYPETAGWINLIK